MKEKYENLLDSYSKSKCGSYVIYTDSESVYSDYESIYKDISKYYNIVSEESDEDKAKRLAKEKAEKRNKMIDLILS